MKKPGFKAASSEAPGAEQQAERSVRALVRWLIGLQILLALVNLPLMSSDERDNARWRAAQATGGEVAPAAPRIPVAWREVVRFARMQVDLDREVNVATWLPTVQLAVLGFVALILRTVRRRAGWLWIALGFLYLSCDEMAQIHEWIGERLAAAGWRIGAMDAPYPWVLLLGPLFLAFAVWMLFFLWRETREARSQRGYLVLAVALLVAVLPTEILGGHLQALAPHPMRLEVIIEESFETLGEAVLLGVFLTLLARDVVLRSRAPRDGDPSVAGPEASGA